MAGDGMTRARLYPLVLAILAACGVARGEVGGGDAKASAKKLPYTTVANMTGKRLPAFDVESGDGKPLASKDLAGRLAIITYETRYVIEKNRAAKAALGRVLKKRFAADSWRVVAIVDTSSANFFTRGVWRRKLVENSKKERIAIYGDWDGKTAKALGVKRDESNLLIVDAAGVIRYFAYGRFDAKEMARQKTLLESLARRGKRRAQPAPAETTR